MIVVRTAEGGSEVSSSFPREVETAFDSLLRSGRMVAGASRQDDAFFGSAFVVLVGRGFEVRVIRDRGDTFADARPTGGSWMPIEQVFAACGVAMDPSPRCRSLAELATMVGAHCDVIEDACSPAHVESTKLAIAALDEEAERQYRLRQARRKLAGPSDDRSR